jgi:hypothetical protein
MVCDAGRPQGGGQMRLAGARTADEHHVVRRSGKGRRGQLREQVLIYPRLREVETGQIAVYLAFGGLQLIANRAHDAVGMLRRQ